MQIDVLGPIRLRDADGIDRTPEGDLQRRLLALLVLHRGSVVGAATAIDVLWPARPPRDPAAALQTHVFRLRRSLPDGLVTSTDTGYRLDPAGVDLDADRLAAGVDDATSDELDEVLARWRGPAYPELGDVDDARIEADRLEELRRLAVERRAALLVAGGRAELALADLRAMVAEHPLRERSAALLVDALAAAGRTAEALRAHDDFRRRLADELGIEPSPAFTARHAELLGGGGGGGWAPEHRLPLPASAILGRDDLLEDAAALVGQHRLVTLLGFGGVGKTRLLLELGHRLRSDRPDRPVVLCELATADEGSAVDVVATALGIEGRPGRDLDEVLASALAGVELVLLLDNCEHVVEAAAALAERLLADAPGVRMVATTRERLRVGGEQLLPVGPLPVEAEQAGEQLFLERARAVEPGFDPSDDDLTCVREIVGRLDGLPLAIELAAARLHTMELPEIAAGLDRRFRLLTAGARTATRHRSLGAAVDWSVGLLDEPLRRAFLDLSVFAGTFTVGDAAAVCALDPADATDAVGELAERSLVLRSPGRRYLLLETLRQYGAEAIDEGAHPDDARGRHAAHVLAELEALDRSLLEDADGAALLAIERMLPELRSALGWQLDHDDLDGAGRLVTSLESYGFFRLRPDVLAWAERVTAADPDDDGPHADGVWAVAALAAWMAGDVPETSRRAARGVAVTERRGSAVPPVLLSVRGSVDLFEGRLADSAAWYRRAWTEAEHPGRRLVNIATEVLARAYALDPEGGRLADDLLAEIGTAGGPHAAYAWYAAGEADLATDLERARVRHRRAMEVAEACGTAFITGVAGTSHASIEARIGVPEVAATEYRRLIGHWRRAGMWSTQWTMLRWVAVVVEALGRPRDAAVLVGAVLGADGAHRVFGEDEVMLAALGDRLREALGAEAYEAALAEGASLDREATVEHALAAL